MIPLFRYVEIGLYALLNYFPFMLLALYPFRDSMRFTKNITCMLIALLSALQILLGIFAAITFSKFTGILSLLSTLIYLAFYFITVKGHTGKKAFFLLMISNIANLIVISSKFIESRLFYELALQKYRYSLSICMFLVELILAFPLYWMFRKVYLFMKTYDVPRVLWNYLWLVPATFYLIWYYHLYSSNLSSAQIAMRLDHLLWLIAINAGSMLIYFIIFQMIREMKKNKELSDTNHVLEIQQLQYHALDKKIQDSRKARHDFRHHLRMMNAFINDQKYTELQNYMAQYQTLYDEDTSVYFCEHYALNAILVFYAQQARHNHISFEADQVCIPKDLGIPDHVITVLVSNLLENAFEACLISKANAPFIQIKGKMDGRCLFLMIKNQCDQAPKTNHEGHFLSTKHTGVGVGTLSAEDMVRQNGGKIQFLHQDHTFMVSILLNTQP